MSQNGPSILEEENKRQKRHPSTKDLPVQSVSDNKHPKGPESVAARNLNSSEESFRESNILEPNSP